MWIEKVVKYHKDWLRILYSLGCDYMAEDIVQEVYINLMRKSSEKQALKNGEPYIPYMYAVLRNTYLNYVNKKNKITKIPLEDITLTHEIPSYEDKEAFEEFSDRIRGILRTYEDDESTLSGWYREKLYDIYTSPEDPSFRTMAKETEISFMTIYNDFKNIKRIIKEHKDKLQDEWNEI
jgi:RNA polymerase sigma factor (sigma-70 family)